MTLIKPAAILTLTCRSKDHFHAHHIQRSSYNPDRNPRKGRTLPHTEVEFVLKGKVVELRRATKAKKKSRGELLVEHLRSDRGDINMTTDEIMELTRGE